jgi:predicted acylesterase/phospholipase RssA
VITGEELRLSDGPTLDALLATTALPGVLSPVGGEQRPPIRMRMHRIGR